nr:RNA polymerase subunit sigma-70 [Deltaproteobacteria bacterium]
SLGPTHDLAAQIDITDEHAATLNALDVALKRLEQVAERQARVVECRFFGGLSVEDTATALGISPRTAKRDWTFARAWLRREMQLEAGPLD